MRGKVFDIFHKFFIVGITPAHAGKRYDLNVKVLTTPDHPRTCGEKHIVISF